jgi:cytochrome c oxidase cbb3-type subunit 2
MKHEAVEKNIGLLAFFMVIAVSIGGLTQIVPLFFQDVTNKPVEGMKPRTALELEGRDVYIANGCVGCHSQMIRPFRAETERYGHYSVAGESVWDHPFLWGSKRTGPDLARVGGRYSDDWQRAHLYNPRNVVPESKMPAYPFLVENKLDGKGHRQEDGSLAHPRRPLHRRRHRRCKEPSRARPKWTRWWPTCKAWAPSSKANGDSSWISG